jgi:hypothetical protein
MAYTDMSAAFSYKQPLLWKNLDALAENDAALKDNGWQDGTKAVFYQASAPTGWTKDTTYNDRILRVVSSAGGGGSAGTQGISSAITLAHTHSISTEADHAHASGHTHSLNTTFQSPSGSGAGSKGYGVVSGEVREYDDGSSSVSQLISSTVSASPSVTSAGTHNHGGTTGSQLSDITLAYVDAINCTKDVSSGYMDKTTTFGYGDDLGADDTFQDLNDMTGNDSYLQARLTPASTVSLFYNAAAPTGWTKLTTQNDKAVRVVSGSGGGAGGSQAMSSTISLAHSAHSMTAQGSHTHSFGAHTHVNDTVVNTASQASDNGQIIYSKGGVLEQAIPGSSTSKNFWNGSTDSQTPGTSSSESDHTHTLTSALSDAVLAYVDVIQCSKDATGAEPFAYQDLTSFFGDANLLAYQDLNDMGKNDSHIKYRTLPESSACLFFQASAPTTWTRLTTHNDKGVRIVSDSGAASGGSNAISTGLALAHTHPVVAHDHTHTFNHTHSIGTTNSGIANDSARALTSTGGRLVDSGSLSSGFGISIMTDSYSSSATSGTDSHSHGGATGSGLSNVTLAYLDVLLCTKDSY